VSGVEVGARVWVGYFGRTRPGTVVKLGRTRVQVRVVMPSNGHVWVKWFPADKIITAADRERSR
jgi:hypothetical protein